jgi:hypothetical protein
LRFIQATLWYKAGRVLLDNYNSVKIADFGLSNVMADGEFSRLRAGAQIGCTRG